MQIYGAAVARGAAGAPSCARERKVRSWAQEALHRLRVRGVARVRCVPGGRDRRGRCAGCRAGVRADGRSNPRREAQAGQPGGAARSRCRWACDVPWRLGWRRRGRQTCGARPRLRGGGRRPAGCPEARAAAASRRATPGEAAWAAAGRRRPAHCARGRGGDASARCVAQRGGLPARTVTTARANAEAASGRRARRAAPPQACATHASAATRWAARRRAGGAQRAETCKPASLRGTPRAPPAPAQRGARTLERRSAPRAAPASPARCATRRRRWTPELTADAAGGRREAARDARAAPSRRARRPAHAPSPDAHTRQERGR